MSWIRKRDSHILTVGSSTFISDGRFHILKPEKRHVWTLRIRYLNFNSTVNYKIGLTLTFFSCGYSMHSGPNATKNVTLNQLMYFNEKNPGIFALCDTMHVQFYKLDFFSPPYFLIGSDLTTRSVF